MIYLSNGRRRVERPFFVIADMIANSEKILNFVKNRAKHIDNVFCLNYYLLYV